MFYRRNKIIDKIYFFLFKKIIYNEIKIAVILSNAFLEETAE